MMHGQKKKTSNPVIRSPIFYCNIKTRHFARLCVYVPRMILAKTQTLSIKILSGSSF